MECLGIFLVIIYGAMGVWGWINSCSKRNERRKQALKTGKGYYLDDNFNRVDVETGMIYRIEKVNGDICEVNPVNGSIIRNKSRERILALAKMEKEIAKSEGRKRFIYDDRIDKKCHEDGYAGAHWLDMENGNVYVRRTDNFGLIYWFNISLCAFDGLDGRCKNLDEKSVLDDANRFRNSRAVKLGKGSEFGIVYEDKFHNAEEVINNE